MTRPFCLNAIAVAALLAVSPFNAPTAAADDPVCNDEAVKLGEKQFRKCRACHKIKDGKNSIGPHLFGIVGRGIADVEEFGYSDAMAAFGKDESKVWDAETLDRFLASPRKYVKGTKMTFGGFRKEERRKGVICYLKKVGGS